MFMFIILSSTVKWKKVVYIDLLFLFTLIFPLLLL